MKGMNSLHLQPVFNSLPVILGEYECVALPFALPVLPGIAGAQELQARQGVLPDLCSIASVLHEDAALGSASQGLYIAPRMIDAARLGLLLPEAAQQTIAEAMVADALEVAAGRPSRLEPLLPPPQLENSPLAFLVGVIFREFGHREPLQITRPGWWNQSEVRRRCESMFGGQLAELGLPVPFEVMPAAPSAMDQALINGLLAVLLADATATVENLSVVMESSDIFRIQASADPDGPVLRLSRHLLGRELLEQLLDEAAARLRQREQASPIRH